MVDWKRVKCTQCHSFRHCRKKSVSKGSAYCEFRRGIISPSRANMWGRIRGAFSFFGKLKRNSGQR